MCVWVFHADTFSQRGGIQFGVRGNESYWIKSLSPNCGLQLRGGRQLHGVVSAKCVPFGEDHRRFHDGLVYPNYLVIVPQILPEQRERRIGYARG